LSVVPAPAAPVADPASAEASKTTNQTVRRTEDGGRPVGNGSPLTTNSKIIVIIYVIRRILYKNAKKKACRNDCWRRRGRGIYTMVLAEFSFALTPTKTAKRWMDGLRGWGHPIDVY
jgi:hypothetical protein